MAYLYPRQDALQNTFASPYSWTSSPRIGPSSGPSSGSSSKSTPRQGRPDLFIAASIVDDAKNKAKKLSAEATKELEKASGKAQAATGGIELYSLKYYAACTMGGILACVCVSA